MKKSQKIAAVLGVVGFATLAFAYTSPSGMIHANSSTCSLETCQRICRICCLHFHPDNLSAAYLGCIAGCTGPVTECDSTPGGGDA